VFCRKQPQSTARSSSSKTRLNACVYLHMETQHEPPEGQHQGRNHFSFFFSWLNFQSTSSRITACKTHVDVLKEISLRRRLILYVAENIPSSDTVASVTLYSLCNALCDIFVWAGEEKGEHDLMVMKDNSDQLNVSISYDRTLLHQSKSWDQFSQRATLFRGFYLFIFHF